MSLQIYRASAGSGKTFQLSASYVKLVLHNPESYKNILAVTFTNAATAEMKERIINDLLNLYKYPNNKKSQDLLNVIVPDLNKSEQYNLPDGVKWTAEIVQKRAGIALQNILHNYTFFRIETIDSFFQSVLRNLIHELGLSGALSVELDNTTQVDNAIQIMFDKSKTEKALQDAIINFSMHKNKEGKGGYIDGELKKMGEKILKENFLSNTDISKYKNIFEDIKKYQSKIYAIKKKIENDIKALGESAFLKFGKTIDDFKKIISNGNYAKYIFSYFNKLSTMDEDCFVPSASVSSFANRTHKDTAKIPADILDALNDTTAFVENHKSDYFTAKLILKQIHEIAFIYDIYTCIAENNHVEGKFLLSDTPVLLGKLINPNTAPFIFEKIGTKYDHIMIDEFQDTSAVQWKNFIPLLIESLSKVASNQMEGGQILIVGDPKQSIYRWRNGDWTTIENIGSNDGLKGYVEHKSMDTNFRSSKIVIDFNNTLYEGIAGNIDYILEFSDEGKTIEFQQYKSQIQKVYEAAGQKCSKKDEYGYVEVQQLPGTDFKQNAMEKLVKDIIKCQIEGVSMNDIAVLTRKNSEITEIAEYFAKYEKSEEFKKILENHPDVGLKVISNEAFRLNASLAVRTIIDAIKFVLYPNDKATKSTLAIDFHSIIKKRDINNLLDDKSLFNDEFNEVCNKLNGLSMKPLYELVEIIYHKLGLNEIDNQEAYLLTLLDKIQEYSQNYGSDLNKFLKYWDEKMFTTEIPLGTGNGIRMVTIHKSKGLEYHTVFIPFCNWAVEDTGLFAPTLWCSSTDIPDTYKNKDELLSKQFDPLPISYGKDMENSIFADIYYTEKLMMWIDNINILYVATTRAKNNLFIYCEEKKDKAGSYETNISAYIIDVFKFDDEKNYKIGNIFVKENKNEEKQKDESTRLSLDSTPIPCKYSSFPQKEGQFRQSHDSDEFIKKNFFEEEKENEDTKISSAAYGTLIHYIFSKIKTADDVDRAVEETIMEGVEIADKEEIKATIKEKLNKEEFKDWFASGLKLLNERSIAFFEGDKFKTKKPDRVIVDGKNAIIIDYKSGHESKQYNTQLTKYANLLKEVGFENVSAFLWYLNTDKKVQVV